MRSQTIASFSAGEAAQIAKVPYTSIDYWARTKLVVPSVAAARGSGTERRYDFKDLVALRAVRDLRAAGISTQALRHALTRMREVRNPLTEERYLAIGRTIVWVESADRAVDILKHPDQTVFEFMLLEYPRVAREIKTEIDRRVAA